VRDDNGDPIGIHMVNPLLPYFQKHYQVMNQSPFDTNTTHRTFQKADDLGGLLQREEGEEETMRQYLASKKEALAGLAALVLESQAGDLRND
jgi:hypothetical protein